MTKDINLLPKEYKMELKSNKFFHYLVVATTIIFLLSTLITAIISSRKDEISTEFSYLSEYLGKSMFYDENIELYEALLEKRARLIDVMQFIGHTTFIDAYSLRAIFESIPEGMYMRQVSVDNNTVFFAGISESREKISEYVSDLSVVFKDVIIAYLFSSIEYGFEFVLELRLA